ncbi:MAG: zinc dependent phospholipase C family protein [bacterium]
MPKEYLHWALAERAAQRLKKESHLKAIITQYTHIYLAGAVIFDTPLYFIFGQDSQSFQEISLPLHENNTNSFAPLIRLLREQQEALKEAMWALIAGIITHIIADAQFHPMIFYFSGVSTNENKQRALVRHRTIETALDIACLTRYAHLNSLLFGNIIKHKEIDTPAFYWLLSLVYDIPLNQAPLIGKAITQHCFIQKLFKKKWLQVLSQALNYLPGIHFDEIIPLFYSFPHIPHVLLKQNPIHYKHPVTGTQCLKSIYDMEEDTVIESLKIFSIIDDEWEQQSLIDAFSHLRGPNLTTGMVGVSTKDMKYFDTQKNLNEFLN